MSLSLAGFVLAPLLERWAHEDEAHESLLAARIPKSATAGAGDAER